MPRPSQILVGVTLLIAPEGSSPLVGRESASAVRFELSSVRLEQNATDDDLEIVLEATAGEEGLTKLQVVTPDGRTVVDFTAPAATSGIRHLVFESPEPKGGGGLKKAYPQGPYTFTGVTTAGEKLQGVARLGHKLPATSSLLSPKPGTKGVATKALVLSWTPVEGVAAYIVQLEQPDLNVSLEARLPSSDASFAVPDGFLRPGTTYTLGVGTVTLGGNSSFVETTFTTADK
jgi:hypothetical protein